MLTDFAQAGDWLSTLHHIKFYNFEMLLAELVSIFILFWLANESKRVNKKKKKHSHLCS